MAEAAVENRSSPNRFYCHSCSAEICPNLPEFTCPQCENGFVEEITEDFSNTPSTPPSQDQDPATHFTDLFGRTLMENYRNQSTRSRENRQSERDDDDDERPRPTFTSRRRNDTRERSERYLDIERLLSHLIRPAEMAHTGMLNIFPLHSNPGDYAWGADGFDSVISQLMNQIDGTGVPPAEKARVDALPLVQITQDQVDKNLQCPICLGDFDLNKPVKELDCKHQYHINCIDEWLLLHGNCPVCRKDLNGRDTTAKDYSPTSMDLS